MNIKEMQYDLKVKLNKVDSQQYRNLLIPELDWALNSAEELFIKMISKPRLKNHLGFETSQRTIDDIRVIVEEPLSIPIVNNFLSLPDNYWHYISSEVLMDKGGCTGVIGKVRIQQHDDEFKGNPFEESSFEWREVNANFVGNTLKFYTEGFTVTALNLVHLRRPLFMHNAEDFRGGEYNKLSGGVLTGKQDCELPDHTHREIVDIAVLLITGELQAADYQLKQAKISLNEIK